MQYMSILAKKLKLSLIMPLLLITNLQEILGKRDMLNVTVGIPAAKG